MKRLIVLAVLAVGARAGAQREPGWELRAPERVTFVAGQGGTLAIAIAIDRGRSISKDAGLILDLTPDGGVTVPHRRLGRRDAVDPDADAPRFSVPLHAAAAGDFTVRLHLQFWLCASKVCRPIDVRRTVAVAVTAPAPPPPDAGAPPDAGTPPDGGHGARPNAPHDH